MRTQKVPDIDALIPMVDKALAAYKVCKDRLTAVKTAFWGAVAGVSEALQGSVTTIPTAEMLARYQALRTAGTELNLGLLKELPKAALAECGKKLGLFRHATLVFGGEDEVPVLYDYAFYHFRRGGKNAIERHWILAPPPPGRRSGK